MDETAALNVSSSQGELCLEKKTSLQLRSDVFATAFEACVERGEVEYGNPEDNFAEIGKVWALRLKLDKPIPAAMVALLMVDLKIVRAINGEPKLDTFTDICGYAACAYAALMASQGDG